MRKFLLGLVPLIAFGCGLGAQAPEGSMALEDQTMSMKEDLLSALHAYSAGDYVEVEAFEDIVNDAYFESRNWMTAVFGEAKDPHNEANGARHYYHLWRGEEPGFDLLRHDYELRSRSIVVVESVPIIYVVIRFNHFISRSHNLLDLSCVILCR